MAKYREMEKKSAVFYATFPTWPDPGQRFTYKIHDPSQTTKAVYVETLKR